MAQRNHYYDTSMAEALEAQQQALTELANLVDRQSAMIAGLTIAIGGIVDLIGDADLRERMELHLRIALEQQVPEVTGSIINTIFGPQ
ncbi:hypothetical protein GCM10011611_20020 [Aliidongia dinghuensis]|uniref:Uncharacterized protein n=1 Tax=Aliidongia dinghuensis TaxID=1867774 RepID=A0A8J2YTT4_9PROT|nr:hypothetical protein [Aliidongia dinghuensis]GGF14257.1 hypothetical protein GCM10011611_20020 [Aliidongia dinghuensis]